VFCCMHLLCTWLGKGAAKERGMAGLMHEGRKQARSCVVLPRQRLRTRRQPLVVSV
jgi:hypothetical protein